MRKTGYNKIMMKSDSRKDIVKFKNIMISMRQLLLFDYHTNGVFVANDGNNLTGLE